MTQIKNTKKITCLQIIPSMGIGGVETGVRDIANYLNKKKIENYILCESNDKNFNVKGLKIIKIGNLRFKNIFIKHADHGLSDQESLRTLSKFI